MILTWIVTSQHTPTLCVLKIMVELENVVIEYKQGMVISFHFFFVSTFSCKKRKNRYRDDVPMILFLMRPIGLSEVVSYRLRSRIVYHFDELSSNKIPGPEVSDLNMASKFGSWASIFD